LRLAEADPAEIHLEIVASPHSEELPAKGPLAERVIEALQAQPSMTREELRERLRVKSSRLGAILFELEREGRIVRGAKGWQLGSQPAA
jgi:transcription initiation factor IIE alpha subunit